MAASRRQARRLQMAYAQRMQGEGRSAWPSPDILTWNAWLERCWHERSVSDSNPNAAAPSLLSPQQETGLWEAVVSQSGYRDVLLQTPAVARTAHEAWQLCWDWNVAPPSIDQAPNTDVRAFATWWREFDARCRAHHWQDRARLPGAVREAFAGGGLATPRRLLLHGFEELTPQQERLLERLREAGTRIERVQPVQSPPRALRRELSGPLEELWAAAHWARERLEQGLSQIGIVVPDLGSLRAQVLRIFDGVLVPAAVLPGSGPPVRPYNLSLGRPLSDYPVVHTAFQILDLSVGPLECEEMGGLLRSPFIAGAAAEWSGRALLDVECRRGEPLIDLHRLIRAARRFGSRASADVTVLAQRLEGLRALLDRSAKRQLPSAWAESFARMLAAIGWPGDRTLDSDEYQTAAAWRELLSGFSALDVITGRIDQPEAVSMLRRLAADRVFQPNTPEVPIQIMGLFDAAGLEFDCLWVSGLDDAAWPARARPNPFLSIELQRRHNLPHSSAARELEFARRLTDRLLAGAAEVVISHARQSGDEALRASPLVAHVPLAPPGGAPVPISLHEHIHRSQPVLECLEDARAPSLPDGVTVRRGTGVFKDQAACPFRAFAAARLGARALERPAPGLDAAGRGKLLHRVMETLWRELGSHAALCALSDEGLNGVVRRAVASAAAMTAHERPQTFSQQFAALEQSRLERLVHDWLAIEKQRTPFTVLAPESGRTASIGGVTVKLVIDRVDELVDGSRVVIDYKTGTPKLNHWFGARPEEPQLPIYSLVEDGVAAVTYAQLRRGDSRFIGVAATAGVGPGIEPMSEIAEAAAQETWEGLLAEWRRVVEALGGAFLAGDARVDPKNGSKTCKYCDLGPLCRIRERDEASLVDREEES